MNFIPINVKWSRIFEAGAVVVIIALTLSQTQTRRSLLNFIAQGFPGDGQYFVTLTASVPPTALSPALSQFSASVSQEMTANLAMVQTQFPTAVPPAK